MLLSVRHETSYAYHGLASQLVQLIRMTPRGHDAQEVLDWRITRLGGVAPAAFEDGLGNLCRLVSDRGPIESATILVEGRVRTQDAAGVVSGAFEPLPMAYFRRTTPLTEGSTEIAALAEEATKGKRDRAALTSLMAALGDRVVGVAEDEEAAPSAAAAFEAGRGVSQDLAHVFVAAARALGAPARCVSGYVWPGGSPGTGADDGAAGFAPRAWAEAWAEETGWIGFDVWGGGVAGPSHLRVSVGLDYRQAAPIAGFWRGSATETMRVSGLIEASESGQ
jgi:transglutaminase-like putative cysteine protease